MGFKRDDVVRLRADGKDLKARVLAASVEGTSLILAANAKLYNRVARITVFRQDDGTWVDSRHNTGILVDEWVQEDVQVP